MWVLIVLALSFIVLGVMIRFFKWYWLIAGYNTMPKGRKRQVDTEGLGRFMGNSLFLLAGVMVAGGVMSHYKVPGSSLVMPLATTAVVIYMLIKAQRFDSGALNPDGTMKLSTRIILGSVFVFFAVVGVLIFSNTFASEVVLNAESVQIKGIYGIEIKFNQIDAITLEESLPTVLRRTNGFSAGSTLKGHFLLQDIGRAKLYVNVKSPPFIYINTVDSLIILNQGDRQSTEKLYRTLLNHFQ
jgi:hypothetical protein